jgi:hypothetical protein
MRRFTEEQIVAFVRESERDGMTVGASVYHPGP